MPRTSRPLDTKTFTDQVTVLGPFPVTKVLLKAGLSIDRSGWTDPTIEIELNAYYSTDNGVTWNYWIGFTASGSVDGPPESFVEFDNPPPNGSLVKAEIKTNAGKSIRRTLRLIEDTN